MICLVCRMAAGLVFLISSMGKIAWYGDYVRAVQSYNLIPSNWTKTLSMVLFVCEAVVAASLLSGVALFVGVVVGLWLLAGFTVALAAALIRGERNIECGCMLVAGQRIGWNLCVRNLALAFMLAAAWSRSSAPYLAAAALMGLIAAAAMQDGTNQGRTNRQGPAIGCRDCPTRTERSSVA